VWSSTKKTLPTIILFNIGYRGLVTFSRGGMLTGFIMIILFLVMLYKDISSYARSQLYILFVFMIAAFALTWIYTSNQTSGLINKRYANQDAKGRMKESQFTGREDIWNSEIAAFEDHPVFGVGVAKGLEIRKEKTGETVTSHNEITRTLAEHGTMGIIALLIVEYRMKNNRSPLIKEKETF
jgi:O-antigen ligase